MKRVVAERLKDIADILKVDGTFPPSFSCWLKDALRKYLDHGEPLESAFCIAKRKLISERDDIVITGVGQVEGLQIGKQMARFLAGEARRIQRGRKDKSSIYRTSRPDC